MENRKYVFAGNRAFVLQRMLEFGEVIVKSSGEGINHTKLRDLYISKKPWFPLIVSVIEQNMDGNIFVNDTDNPTHAFVINKFGFCQEAYAEYDDAFFENIIKPYIESSDRMKLRMYSPGKYMQNYLDSLPFATKSSRVHMLHKNIAYTEDKTPAYQGVEIKEIAKEDVIRDAFGLNLAGRYYNGADDFLKNANAVAAYSNGEIVGITYSAGEALGVCEKDIFVKPQYRGNGIGKKLTKAFIDKCASQHKLVSEDIYENNYASIALVKAMGAEVIKVYDYYNIEKI